MVRFFAAGILVLLGIVRAIGGVVLAIGGPLQAESDQVTPLTAKLLGTGLVLVGFPSGLTIPRFR